MHLRASWTMIAPVPNYWIRTSSSPPEGRRDDLRDIAQRYDAELREDELYTPVTENGIVYVLVRAGEDLARNKAMLKEMGALSGTLELLDVAEAQRAYDLAPDKAPESSA